MSTSAPVGDPRDNPPVTQSVTGTTTVDLTDQTATNLQFTTSPNATPFGSINYGPNTGWEFNPPLNAIEEKELTLIESYEGIDDGDRLNLLLAFLISRLGPVEEWFGANPEELKAWLDNDVTLTHLRCADDLQKIGAKDGG